ncbi:MULTISPECIES: hypothetical protein [unclassified Mesorhizobium]|uniref:hypothetical protein n=1 Tax=unclassified Mesorhizobium TaxID=325217 RepID=UPI002414E19D|nr:MULTISPECIES: hypothetical protein [unclassified Mesorhizobium]MDG4889928.1 hypothetical protein [Mesorhizobium sp. WSM4887]MDG4904071.1 hypothetical protein [Mesorhizobium sp. WSM4962]MDG4909098.1 hypothetical protein [Mesorhizobium sp. WSM4898]MDG4921722.1 hypothetical protein [Mesorhizobium sp. WSM4989]
MVSEEHCEMYEMIKRHDEDGVARVFQLQLDSTFPSIEILRAQRPDLLSGDAEVSVADI